MTRTVRTRLMSVALAAAVATTSFGFTAAEQAEAAKRKTPVTKKAGKKAAKKLAVAKASGRKIA